MPTAATLHRLRDRIRRLEQGHPVRLAPGAGGGALPASLSESALPEAVPLGLPAIDAALPWGGLPRGMVHEILCGDPGDGAPTAFLLALIGRQKAAGHAGPVLWVSCRRDLFAPALPVYGCDPADFLFVRCTRGEEVLWAMEDGLRCPALAAVAGDVGRPDFSATRRLQLAAGRGGVPLFLHRPLHWTERATERGGRMGKGGALAPSAAVTRWAVTARLPDPADPPAASGAETGDPAWTVHLHRCRGGRPGRWPVVWDRLQQAFRPAADGEGGETPIPAANVPHPARAAGMRPGMRPGLRPGIRRKLEVYKDSNRNRSGRFGRNGISVSSTQNSLNRFFHRPKMPATWRIGPERRQIRSVDSPVCIHDTASWWGACHAA